jgi:hypothetical protein
MCKKQFYLDKSVRIACPRTELVGERRNCIGTRHITPHMHLEKMHIKHKKHINTRKNINSIMYIMMRIYIIIYRLGRVHSRIHIHIVVYTPTVYTNLIN